jgi:epoxyqueuosine reductase
MGWKTDRYLNPEVHGRFDRRHTVFYRRDIFTGFDHFRPETLDPGNPELLELAEARAAWTLHDNYPAAFTDTLSGNRKLVHNHAPFRYTFQDSKAASENISKVAVRFGASLVGIARLDERWLYSYERSGRPVSLPEKAVWAIVMAIEMDKDLLSTSPALSAAAESGRGYSKMAALAGAVGEYIRLLGYYALSCGNDTSLSIPLAMDAGLGVMGRNGLLLTREYGPSVRICKVITDIELEQSPNDYPSSEEVCSGCTLCVEACEAEALSSSDKPTWDVLTESNNPGVYRWQFNPEKCFDFWLEIGRDCSNCIAACPAASRLAKLMD